MRDDPLKSLSKYQRQKRLSEDCAYLITHASGAATEEAQTVAAQVGVSLGVYSEAKVKPGDTAAIVCSRIDLDTPIYFSDNLRDNCADCDCDIQVRPDVPPELDRLCICCAARRLREEKTSQRPRPRPQPDFRGKRDA